MICAEVYGPEKSEIVSIAALWLANVPVPSYAILRQEEYGGFVVMLKSGDDQTEKRPISS
jgi:hypothetical protein